MYESPVDVLQTFIPYARRPEHLPTAVIIPRDDVKQLTTASDGGVTTIITKDGVIIDIYDYDSFERKIEMLVVKGEEKKSVKLNDHVTVSLFEKELWVIF